MCFCTHRKIRLLVDHESRAGVFNGQSKSFGNTSFFVNWDSVSEVAQKLPRGLHEARVIVRYPSKNVEGRDALRTLTGLKEMALNVDPQKLRSCIGWLKVNNPLYETVVRDDETLASLARERAEAMAMGLEDVFRDWDQREQRFTTALDVDPVAPREVGRVVGEQYGRTEVTRDGGPVRAHEVPNLLAQCIPTLFPYGEGANYRTFTVPLTTSEMLEHTIRFGDPRFSRHYRYLFMMVNVKNLDIGYRSISATLKGRVKRSKLNGELDDITEEVIARFSKTVCTLGGSSNVIYQDFENSKDFDELMRRKHIVFSVLRGTQAYWEKQKSRIRHMIAMKGPPTAFATFSSADNFWVDIEDYFKSYVDHKAKRY